MRIRQGLLGGLMGLALACTGCMGKMQQLSASPSAAYMPAVTWEQQHHVYVFLINGIDPFHMGNLIGLRQQLADMGYDRSYYGQLYHCRRFANEMRRIHADDPQARFVLVGFSMGAMPAYYLAEDAREDGLPVDLVVLIAGKGMKAIPDFHPDPAIRVVDIATVNYLFRGKFPNPARAVEELDAGHFAAPTHDRTVQALSEELSQIASRVPIQEMELGPEPDFDLANALRPVEELTTDRMSRTTVPVSAPPLEH